MKVLPDHTTLQLSVLDERFYQSPTDPEKFYPGATTILSVWPKGQLTEWFKNVGHNADIILKRAGEEGSRVHDAIQNFLLGLPITWETDGVQNYSLLEWQLITKFQEFYWTYQPQTLEIEKILVSDTLEFGGMLDWICTINGETWYIDHKTSNSIWKEHSYQLSAYMALLAELDYKIDRVGLLHLKAGTRTVKEKDFQGLGWKLYDITDKIEHGFKMFQTAQTIWRDENPNFKPKNRIYPMGYILTENPFTKE